jgi:hypothetical protein
MGLLHGSLGRDRNSGDLSHDEQHASRYEPAQSAAGGGAGGEMRKFERKKNEFRKKDREERAAELHLPLDAIKVH